MMRFVGHWIKRILFILLICWEIGFWLQKIFAKRFLSYILSQFADSYFLLRKKLALCL